MLLFPFLLSLFEWYEFSIYNSIIPYLSSIVGGKSDVYLGSAILVSSFIARPIGSIILSRLNNPLITSLKIISISTLFIAILPTIFLPKWMLICWLAICKFMQGFALGGSYGQNYISVYENSDKNEVCYRVALVQMGFLVGIILGEISMFALKLIGNNSIYAKASQFFITLGWRIPFLISAMIGSILLFYSDQFSISGHNKPFQFNSSNLTRYFLIFLAISLEMNLFYMWFVYSPIYSEFIGSNLIPSLMSWLQKVLTVALFPIAGILCDRIGSCSSMLLLVCGLTIALSPLAPWNGMLTFFLSSIITAICYASLIPWVMSVLTRGERRSIMGTMYGLSSSIFGGTIPIVSFYLQDKFGFKAVGGLMLIYTVLSAIGIILITRQNTIDNNSDLE